MEQPDWDPFDDMQIHPLKGIASPPMDRLHALTEFSDCHCFTEVLGLRSLRLSRVSRCNRMLAVKLTKSDFHSCNLCIYMLCCFALSTMLGSQSLLHSDVANKANSVGAFLPEISLCCSHFIASCPIYFPSTLRAKVVDVIGLTDMNR